MGKKIPDSAAKRDKALADAEGFRAWFADMQRRAALVGIHLEPLNWLEIHRYG